MLSLGRLCTRSEVPCSSNFMTQRNLLNYNKYQAKTVLWHLRASHLRIRISYFCSRPVPGRHFFIFYVGFMRTWPIWGPPKNLANYKIRRHRLVSGVVKYKNVESGQNLSLSGQSGLCLPPRLAPAIPGDPTFRQASDLFPSGAHLLTEQQNIKKVSLPKSTKISKINTSDAQGFNFYVFGATSWISIFKQFSDHLIS